MTAYAGRLANAADTAPRVRQIDTLGLAPAGSLQAREGLRPDGGGVVTVVAGTMDVSVSAFSGWVDGDASAAQGGYPFVNDSARVLTLANGHASLARVDLIVARVRDTTFDASGFTDADVVVIAGTPGSGVPAVPAGCMPLREVNVPAGLSAGTGGLSAGNLGSDRRRWTSALGGILPVVDQSDRDGLTPYEGMTVWRQDTDLLQVHTGAAWVDYTPANVQRKRKTANQVVNNSTTPVADTHLTFTAEANTAYLVTAMLLWAQAGGGASAMDAQVGFSLPAGASYSGRLTAPELNIVGGGTIAEAEFAPTVGAFAGTMRGGISNVAAGTGWELQATVTIGATPGTVALRWAQNTAAAFDLTLLSGSWLRAEKF